MKKLHYTLQGLRRRGPHAKQKLMEEYPHCQHTNHQHLLLYEEFTTGCHSSVYLNEDLIPRVFQEKLAQNEGCST